MPPREPALTGTSCRFTFGNPLSVPSDFVATIDWGDGSPTDTGVVTVNPDGGFFVSGTHTYQHAGLSSFSVSVADPAGNSNSGANTAAVGYGTVAASLAEAAPTEGTPFTGTLASFTDSNTQASTSDFGATITWPSGGPARERWRAPQLPAHLRSAIQVVTPSRAGSRP